MAKVQRLWTSEESVVLIKAYMRDKTYRSLVAALSEAGFDRDITSIKGRVRILGLPGDPPMTEEQAIAESNSRGYNNARTGKQSARHWNKPFVPADDRTIIRCLGCGDMFGSWDRKKNRLCNPCRGGDQMEDMSA